jgi:putative SOS response-associated peptidase YedK
MCVRYTLHKTDAALAAISRALGVLLEAPEGTRPRYNVSLTDTMPVVALAAGSPVVRAMRWGMVPASDRGKARPRLLANARSETASALPAFRNALARRRALVPANGFYEWLNRAGVKKPYLFTLRNEQPFAFAGIWEQAVDGLPETYCLLTTEPNDIVASVHNRMPVILTPETMPRWLGDRPLEAADLADLVRPISADCMESRPVSRFMSNSRHEGPGCLAPPDDEVPGPEFDFA